MPRTQYGNRYNFTSAGADASDALLQVLAQQEQQKLEAEERERLAAERERRRGIEDETLARQRTLFAQSQQDRERTLREKDEKKQKRDVLIGQYREALASGDPQMLQVYREELENLDFKTVAPIKPDMVQIRTVGKDGRPVSKFVTREQAAAMGEIPEYREPREPRRDPVEDRLAIERGLRKIEMELPKNPQAILRIADQAAVQQWKLLADPITGEAPEGLTFEQFRDAIRQQYREEAAAQHGQGGPAPSVVRLPGPGMMSSPWLNSPGEDRPGPGPKADPLGIR